MPTQGIYAGIPYIVAEKDNGKKYIGLGPAGLALKAQGANMKLLDDIGDQDPDDVMAALFESIPKKPEQ
jgi:hypothetical protein